MSNEIKEILDKLKYVSNDIKVHIKDGYIIREEIPSSMSKELRLNSYSAKALLDYITNLQERIGKAIEYLTSYGAISTIQGLDNIKKNKELDENTMNIMTNRYLEVHHKLLDILKGDSNE